MDSKLIELEARIFSLSVNFAASVERSVSRLDLLEKRLLKIAADLEHSFAVLEVSVSDRIWDAVSVNTHFAAKEAVHEFFGKTDLLEGYEKEPTVSREEIAQGNRWRVRRKDWKD